MFAKHKFSLSWANEITNQFFSLRRLNYNLLTRTIFFFRNPVNSSKYVKKFSSKIWQMVLIEMKSLTSIEDFKRNIKKCEQNECDGKLCKDFISSLRYVNFFRSFKIRSNPFNCAPKIDRNFER